jgi:ferric enterobactin receptor
MIKLIGACLIIILFCGSSFGQSTFTISGIIANKNDGKLVGFATVSLIDTNANIPKFNLFSSEDGKFVFNKIPAGNYFLMIKSVGIRDYKSSLLTITSSLKLDTIFVELSSKDLKVVDVVATRPIIEIETDKIIYNVENDPTLLGQSAIDALKKLPFVTVDAEDNIQLKGSSNFRVLLNGKSTGLVAKNPSEALKSFPANIIKKIEVITEPSAKYDADGTSGIINIITHKKVIGYNGNIYGSYSTRGMNNFGGSLNMKKGKMGFSSYFGGNMYNYVNQTTNDLNRENKIPGYKSIMNQHSTSNSNGLWQWGNLELAFDFDTLHNLSIYASPNGGFSKGNNHQITEIRDSIGKITESFITDVITENINPSFDVGMDFTKIFKDNADHEMSVSAMRQTNIDNSNFNSIQNYLVVSDRDINNKNISKNIEHTFKLDYEKPLKNKKSFETGTKLILRHLVSDYQMLERRDTSEDYLENLSNTNTLKYDQNVGSLYATYSFFLKDYKMKLGGRAEQTWINAAFNADSMPIKNNYLNLIPTASISRKIKKIHTIRLNYSKRIQRPWMFYLNPYVNNQNPRSISYGNPNLLPEKTHSVSLSWNHYYKQKSFDVSLSNSFTNDVITSFSWLDSSDISYTSYFNMAKSNTIGLNLSFNGTLFSKLVIWANYSTSFVKIINQKDASRSRSGFSNRGHGNLTYNFKYGLSASLGGYVWQGAPTLQSRRPLGYNYNLSVRKALLKKKLNVGLVANNIFAEKQSLTTITDDPSFYSEAIYTNNQFRYFSVSLSYNFGKLKESVSRKKGVNNDDKKNVE